MKKTLCVLVLGWAAGAAGAAELDRTPLEAVTASGDKVRLFPNGRWEFADAAKAAAAQQAAAHYPENKTRPLEAQGGLFGGIGRSIMPGDKDYNRGSLNPKAH
ncbi:MAG: hypothetical protein H6R15_3094 [Proteobacteria bacterium]|nr:hypothetical protein [Pseudomonadota bacterium]